MSVDPYHAVQREISGSLQSAAQLRASYVRIRNMAVREDNEELVWARNELKATLAALDADLEDLEESVKIVESTDARMFGLDDTEVQDRRRYVGHVRREIDNMRAELTNSARPPLSPQPLTPRTPRSPYSERAADDDHQEAWARQEQQMMMQDQERTMDSISGTLSTLAQQAGLMGQEILEHNEMLDDLEQGVDRTDTKLNDAMSRMRRFIRQSEEKGSGYCIIILIIILAVLLLLIIIM
ncbi:SNARE domain protein [Mycena indigotica]|uniref:SNARE domain protein n=1 Tax=Mycena indigotica TaxID=2126181 RepID=A0A8H6TFJ2_9AGAR|nr:SNARE domain protein [Mycena indigotica]KAF7316324.1 SNARE domain protein [Mycena indigotica]